ncbi:uncharacterized protein C6orf118 homolog [Sorex araneus]|uniref:uncharacterized protein C6orf118 homolog n=1 Tax=Sorex araneus TaxID=42254 RepID=UPI002433943B|nr:uncharacterized protein C6orf118 homolog [Sorex araneus]
MSSLLPVYLRWRHCETPGVRTLCNLRKLLNRLQRAHQEHILLYTSGHLNHHNLYQPPRQEASRWAGSRGPPLGQGEGPRPPPDRAAQMADALVDFTLHTALTPDDAEGSRLFRYLNLVPQDEPHPSEEDLLLECRPGTPAPGRPRRGELRWPEMRVLRSKYWRSSRKCGQDPGRDEHRYVSAYLAGLTKGDQYRAFLHFQRDVLATRDLLSSGITGSETALALERKLERELQRVCACEALDFNRLHVCGELFQDLCNSSLTFGDLLQEIKGEYELYMAILLHSQPAAQYQALRAHVRAMDCRTLKTEEVSQAKEELKALVKAVKAALEHNDRLREELETERLRLQEQEARPGECPSLLPFFFFFFFFGGGDHTRRCTGVTPGSSLRNYPWRCSGDHMGCYCACSSPLGAGQRDLHLIAFLLSPSVLNNLAVLNHKSIYFQIYMSKSRNSSKMDQVDDECLTHAQKVEAKRCEILNKWDEIKAIENEIKTNMIHIGALNISESKYKSIEAETQKLEIEIRILKKNIAITEKQLKQRIEKTKMHEKKQQLWMFINDFVSLDDTLDDPDLIGGATSETNLVPLT